MRSLVVYILLGDAAPSLRLTSRTNTDKSKRKRFLGWFCVLPVFERSTWSKESVGFSWTCVYRSRKNILKSYCSISHFNNGHNWYSQLTFTMVKEVLFYCTDVLSGFRTAQYNKVKGMLHTSYPCRESNMVCGVTTNALTAVLYNMPLLYRLFQTRFLTLVGGILIRSEHELFVGLFVV